MSANLVLTNGVIYTQDAGQPTATAVAISGDRILAVGSDSAMQALLGAGGKRLDLAGRCVTPGLVDAHVHFQDYSLSLQRINLMDTATLDEALARVAAGAAKAGAGWVRGRGWNQSLWAGGAFPTYADLDRVVPERPVALSHRSGHALWVNSRAMQLAGLSAGTPDPPGGQIQRDSAGQPTGIFFEDAIDLIMDHIPEASEDELVDAMRLAQQRCLEAGLTGIHDFDGRRCFWALQRLRSEGELGLRVVKNIPVYRLDQAIGVGLRSGFGDEWLRIGGVKIFADGALGSRTAAMIAPYAGEPENRGIVVTDKEEIFARAAEASRNGLSVTVHAIGDRANHDVLDVFAAVREQEKASGARLRHRIEHVQLLHADDVNRLAELDIIASMQPIHATADMAMADRYWGERARLSYAWRSVLQTGAVLAFGSDAPVESIEPLQGIYAAVTRRRLHGEPGLDGWYPEQRLTMAEAVHGFTMGPAIASGQEAVLGSIAAGKLADLTIFERDIFQINRNELPEAQIAGTIVGGQVKYRSW
jgi:predicted amidohydrolase YtcJ